MRLLKQLIAVVAVAFLGSRATALADGNAWLTLVAGTATAVLTLLTYAWVVRRTEHREVTEVSRTGAGRTLGRGALLGIGLFAAVIAVIAVLGGYRIAGAGSPSGALALLGVMAGAAVTEELIFRGILFRIIEGRTGTYVALVLTGLLFGLMHLANPQATLWGAIAIAIQAGGMLGAVYAATRKLWLPIGLHFGWNIAEAGIFGTGVSGTDATHGLLDGVTSGGVLLSGGAFGPEASIFSVLGGVIVTIVFLRLAHRRGRLVSRRTRAAESPSTATLSR